MTSRKLLARTRAIARKQPWCDPKRIASCHNCACRKEARGRDPFPIPQGRGPGDVERLARALAGKIGKSGPVSFSRIERRRVRGGYMLAIVGATVVMVKD